VSSAFAGRGKHDRVLDRCGPAAALEGWRVLNVILTVRVRKGRRALADKLKFFEGVIAKLESVYFNPSCSVVAGLSCA
jgi:hypothetical protein